MLINLIYSNLLKKILIDKDNFTYESLIGQSKRIFGLNNDTIRLFHIDNDDSLEICSNDDLINFNKINENEEITFRISLISNDSLIFDDLSSSFKLGESFAVVNKNLSVVHNHKFINSLANSILLYNHVN
jgi:hypothetical protein